MCSVPNYYLGGCIQTHKQAARMSQTSSSAEAAARVNAMLDDEADADDKDSTESDGPDQASDADPGDFVDDRSVEAEAEAEEPPNAANFDTGNPVMGQTRFDRDIEEVAARAEQREEEHNLRKALQAMDAAANGDAATYVPMTPVAGKKKYSDVFPVSPCVCVWTCAHWCITELPTTSSAVATVASAAATTTTSRCATNCRSRSRRKLTRAGSRSCIQTGTVLAVVVLLYNKCCACLAHGTWVAAATNG